MEPGSIARHRVIFGVGQLKIGKQSDGEQQFSRKSVSRTVHLLVCLEFRAIFRLPNRHKWRVKHGRHQRAGAVAFAVDERGRDKASVNPPSGRKSDQRLLRFPLLKSGITRPPRLKIARVFTVTGRELSDLFSRGYGELLASHVARTPAMARKRIHQRWGSDLTLSGAHVPGISLVRQAIRATSPDPRVPHGLAITAPHTHWDDGLPILISFNGSAYLLGERVPEPEARYNPVSFTFSRDGPIPYEWIDQSVQVDQYELETLWDVVAAVNHAVADEELPLGLALNFRFKQLLDQAEIPTAEFQGTGPAAGTSLCVIYRYDDVDPRSTGDLEQVSWHAFPGPTFDSEAQINLLAALRHEMDISDAGDGLLADHFTEAKSGADLRRLLAGETHSPAAAL